MEDRISRSQDFNHYSTMSSNGTCLIAPITHRKSPKRAEDYEIEVTGF